MNGEVAMEWVGVGGCGGVGLRQDVRQAIVNR